MEKYVVVIGCANVDIGGRPAGRLIARDSNPGAVHVSYGGVGRNIAHDLALLGVKVYMLTALGGDVFAPGLLADCERSGIDMRYAARFEEERSSAYVFISDPDGDMNVAVCDAAISERIDESYLGERSSLLRGASAVVLDGNLSERAIRYAAGNCSAPIFADPVSVGKAERLLPVMDSIDTLKPNIYEAEALSRLRITDMASLEAAAERLLELGVGKVCISLGARGLYYAAAGTRLLVPAYKAELKNATGGGDAMTAMLVKARLEGYDAEKTARLAAAAGAIAVEAADAVNTEMCMAGVLARAQEKEK